LLALAAAPRPAGGLLLRQKMADWLALVGGVVIK
jgi:hypothetical protein